MAGGEDAGERELRRPGFHRGALGPACVHRPQLVQLLQSLEAADGGQHAIGFDHELREHYRASLGQVGLGRRQRLRVHGVARLGRHCRRRGRGREIVSFEDGVQVRLQRGAVDT